MKIFTLQSKGGGCGARQTNITIMLIVLVLSLLITGAAFADINDSGLVGYYNFDDCTAADNSGTNNNGMIIGGAQCVQGINGNALDFGGVYNRGYVTIPNSATLSFLDNYSFNVWFNIQDHISMDGMGRINAFGMQSIFAKAGDRNGLIVRTVRDTNDGLLYLLTHNGRFPYPDHYGMLTSQGFDLYEWHMVTVTSGAGEVNVYFDCELQNSIATAQFNVNTTMQNMPLQFGVDQGATWYPLNGILDEARVYHRALSEDEVRELYKAAGFGNCPGENLPPVADAGPDQTVECSGLDGTPVTLDGSGSGDPEGDALTYTWTWNGSSASGVSPTITLPYGKTTLALTVDDGNGGTAIDTVNIDVADTTPAVVNVSVTPNILWPPNHKYVNVAPSVTVQDACLETTSVKLVTATSNEPDNGLGDGDTANDIVINADGTISLRAERSGKGTGRVYTIKYQATDMGGNQTTSSADVTVPHDIGKK